MFVLMLSMAGQTAGPIKTKLRIGTHVDPGSVLGKVKVKVIWRHLANANKTPHRGPKGRENSRAKRDKYGGQRPAGPRQWPAETTPAGGRVLTASLLCWVQPFSKCIYSIRMSIEAVEHTEFPALEKGK